MIKNRCLRFIILIACFFLLAADEAFTGHKGAVYYNLNIHRGRMTPHYAVQAALNEYRITGADFSAIFLKSNEATIKNTVSGVGYFFSNLLNNEVYGHVHSAYFSLLFPLLTDKFPVQLKLGMGPESHSITFQMD